MKVHRGDFYTANKWRSNSTGALLERGACGAPVSGEHRTMSVHNGIKERKGVATAEQGR
jgi:hypothetical protein